MYDGGSMTSPIIGEYCGSTPPDIITMSNEILIRFVTNPWDLTDIGFKLVYNPTSNQHGPDRVKISCNPIFFRFTFHNLCT